MSDCEDEDDDFVRLRENDPSLTCFSYYVLRPSKLVTALQGNTHLKRLSLTCDGNVYGSSYACEIGPAVESSQVTHLDLDFDKFEGQSTEMASSLINAARRSSTIQHLGLNTVEDEGLGEIAACIPHLQTLRLSGDFLAGDMELLVEGLRNSSTLTTLQLSWVRLSSGRISMLSQGLSRNISVTTLCLESIGIDDDGIKAFIQHWRNDSQIRTLAFTNDKIKAEGAMLLVQAASIHPALESLSIHGNSGIGYDGLANIAMALPTITLKELNMSSCAFEYTGDPRIPEASAVVGRVLVQGLHANTHLVKMNVSNNGFDAMEEQLSFCTLRNKYTQLVSSLGDLQFSPNIWCHLFAKPTASPSFVFHFFRELILLWQRASIIPMEEACEE